MFWLVAGCALLVAIAGASVAVSWALRGKERLAQRSRRAAAKSERSRSSSGDDDARELSRIRVAMPSAASLSTGRICRGA